VFGYNKTHTTIHHLGTHTRSHTRPIQRVLDCLWPPQHYGMLCSMRHMSGGTPPPRSCRTGAQSDGVASSANGREKLHLFPASWVADAADKRRSACSYPSGRNSKCATGEERPHAPFFRVAELQCVPINPLTPNDHYSGRTAPLTSKRCILYIYSTNIGGEYFKHGIYSPVLSLKNTVCFIILTYLVPILFTFNIQGVLKLKKNNSGAKRLITACGFPQYYPKRGHGRSLPHPTHS